MKRYEREASAALRRIAFSVLLTAFLLFPASGSGAEKADRPYERVIIFAVDAVGTTIRDVDTPNFDRIFGEGAVTFEAKATVPTKSAQGWGAMFYGVPGPVHGTDNARAESNHKINELYPSIFRLAKEAYPKNRVAVFSNWHAIPWGLIEWNSGVDVFPSKVTVPTMAEVYKRLRAYLEKKKPILLLVYNGDVDTALHEYGYQSKEYYEALQTADSEIGMLYDELQEKGLLENALVLFATDHGGKEKSHGGNSEQEINCVFAAAGPGVEEHGQIEDMELRDVAAIVLYALGIEQPEIQTGRVPKGIFPDIGGGEHRKDPFPELLASYGSIESAADVQMPEDLQDKLAYFQTFEEETVKGLSGGAKLSDSPFGKALDMRESYLKTGVKVTSKWPGFTVGFWFRDEGENGDPVFLADKNWFTGKNKGFAVTKADGMLQITIGGGQSFRKDLRWVLPDGYKGRWIHCLAVFDQKTKQVSLYVDFEYAGSAELLPKRYSGWGSGKEIVAGQDITEKYRYWMNGDMDEIMIFKEPLTAEEVRELKDWYDLRLKGPAEETE